MFPYKGRRLPPNMGHFGMWIMPLGNQGQVDSGKGFTSFLTDSKNLDMGLSPERQLLTEITFYLKKVLLGW